MKDIDILIDIISREKLNTMSGKQKIAYKYCICSLFINLIGGHNNTERQRISIEMAEKTRKLPRKQTDFNRIITEFSSIVNSSLEEYCFKPPYDEDFINSIIKFFREKLNDIKVKQKSLFLVSEFSRWIDFKKYFKIESVSDHHWVEFSLMRGFILTIPECILFNDLKVQWNMYLETKNKLSEGKHNITFEKDLFDYYKKEETRENLYKISALHRGLIFISVSFVEAYLYNLFYCIKNTCIEGKNDIEDVLSMKKIEDEQIIKQVIYHLFPSMKDVLAEDFSKYREVLKYRDRYVHASPFADSSSGNCETQPLINLDSKQLVDYIQTCLDFVLKIDGILPSKLKLLFWWYNGIIKFEDYEKVSLVNKEARISKINYEALMQI